MGIEKQSAENKNRTEDYIKNSTKTNIKALTDIPSASDSISISKHMEGFAEYIKTCATPTTIAVQGSWGTGKSTCMEIIKDYLDRDGIKRKEKTLPIIIDFNTWQYSQFNLGDQLVISLLITILDKLSLYTGNKKKVYTSERILRDSLDIGKMVLLSGIKVATGRYLTPQFASTIFEGIKSKYCSKEIIQDSSLALLAQLKQDLQNTVNDALQITSGHSDIDKANNSNKRVYIFIDDLDRLPPIKAVEIMEALNIFLNLDNCVFILAIDFQVVVNGVKEKYGQNVNEAKARSFFDKIIQLSYHLPTDSYDIERYLKVLLKEANIKDTERLFDLDIRGTTVKSTGKSEEQDFSNLAIGALIGYSIGNNPRSIKRLVNKYKMLEIINSKVSDIEETNADEKRPIKEIALLCFEAAYPQVYEDWKQGNIQNLKSTIFNKEDNTDNLEQFISLINTLIPVEDSAQIREIIENTGRLSTESKSKNSRIGTKLMPLETFKDDPALKNISKVFCAFNDTLRSKIGSVLVGRTPKYFGYVRDTPKTDSENYNFNSQLSNSRFMELHPSKTGFSVKFGKHIATDNEDTRNKFTKNIGKLLHYLDGINFGVATPPITLNGIDTDEKAKEAALVVAAICACDSIDKCDTTLKQYLEIEK